MPLKARNTVNDSLHNLELALDRHKNHSTGRGDGARALSSLPASVTGLEFLLRTVAEDVSSTAPGSQGGLLNQIKAFNVRLEAIASRLGGTSHNKES
jgi:hypothetical protein